MKPLVSILIPAYNSEAWISDTIRSAVAQTWERKEIIVVNDGSTDRTEEIAQRFSSDIVTVVSTKNQGAAAARNTAYELSSGDYIQWLDADDIMSPAKIENQLAALRESDGKRILLSSPWAFFHFRTSSAQFVPTSLWHDLSPVDWLVRKMSENLFMQTATWLTSRELAEAAGPWDTRLISDDDGEFFCRVLVASEGTRFVHDANIFYRAGTVNNLGHVGQNPHKLDALFLSMRLHIHYLRSLEDSDRVRDACLTYLSNWLGYFYPDRPDLYLGLQSLAEQLQGRLGEPRLRWKYAWIAPILGWRVAKGAQAVLPEIRMSWGRQWDRAAHKLAPERTTSRSVNAEKDSGTPDAPSVEAARAAKQSLQIIKSSAQHETEHRIPKRIIQTGKQPGGSLRNQGLIANVRLLNPDFEYLFFDDAQVEDFVDQEFPQYRAVFDSFRFPIQRYDFFRYLAVYRYGGFYFDVDVLLAKSLSPLLETSCVFPFEAVMLSHYLRDNFKMDWQMGNYAFGAAAGHPFLRTVIENCVIGQKYPDWVKPMMRGTPVTVKDEYFILNSTGPGLISRTLAENPHLANTVTVLFPDDVCDLRNWNRFGDYGVHLMDSSWRQEKSFLHRKIRDLNWGRIQNRRVEDSRRLGKLRRQPGANSTIVDKNRDQREESPICNV
jgi:glycosyltransferase involved in cell wall biosynthesis